MKTFFDDSDTISVYYSAVYRRDNYERLRYSDDRARIRPDNSD